MTSKPEVTPPNFGLQRKLGAPVKYLPPSILLAADKAIAQQAEKFDGYFRDVLARWKSAAEIDVDQIYKDSHELRGLAGTFDRVGLGRVANALCIYIDAARQADEKPNEETIKAIKDALATCAALETSDPEASAKLADRAVEAVNVKIAAF
jgi:hypothetical protein